MFEGDIFPILAPSPHPFGVLPPSGFLGGLKKATRPAFGGPNGQCILHRSYGNLSV